MLHKYKIDILFRRPTITNIFKMNNTLNFPYDPVNRIQKLFYDYDFDDIPTIYNKNKLLKTKTK